MEGHDYCAVLTYSSQRLKRTNRIIIYNQYQPGAREGGDLVNTDLDPLVGSVVHLSSLDSLTLLYFVHEDLLLLPALLCTSLLCTNTTNVDTHLSPTDQRTVFCF